MCFFFSIKFKKIKQKTNRIFVIQKIMKRKTIESIRADMMHHRLPQWLVDPDWTDCRRRN